jgi:pimeloyl-ACP methyl ester carboxylesterase
MNLRRTISVKASPALKARRRSDAGTKARSGRRLLATAAAAAMAVLGVAIPASAAPEHVDASPQCRTVTIPMTLTNGAKAHLSGQYCAPPGPRPAVVQLLVHGFSYNHDYWDSWPGSTSYGYVGDAVRAGYATLAIDRLGDGQSSRPPSKLVTFDQEADTLHQAVQALRTGGPVPRFAHVILVGHSTGSAEGGAEAAWFHDVDAVILTGSGQAVSSTTESEVAGLKPAARVSSRFAGLDSGYVTSPTVTARQQFLYNPADSDPRLIAYDWATEDTGTTTELSTRPATLPTKQLNVPVLLLNGQDDNHYCGTGLDNCSTGATLYTAEKNNYPACFAAGVVPGSGHDLTTEYGAPIAARKMLDWAWRTLPPFATGAAHCGVVGGMPQAS